MALSAQNLGNQESGLGASAFGSGTSGSATPQAILAGISTMDFDSFYRKEFAPMVALARAIIGDHQRAEDLAQEAMSRAHRNWTKVSVYDRPGAWLRRVTINLALSRRRRAGRELAMLRRTADDERLRVPGDEPMSGSDDEVWAAVRRLPPKQRAAIALFYQEDQSTSDIAEILGCSVSTATSHLSQARTRLATWLNEEVA